MASSDASGSVRIPAAPNTVYSLLTDLDILAELAEETTVDRRPRGFELVGGFSTGVKDRGAANAAHIEPTRQRPKRRAESA